MSFGNSESTALPSARHRPIARGANPARAALRRGEERTVSGRSVRALVHMLVQRMSEVKGQSAVTVSGVSPVVPSGYWQSAVYWPSTSSTPVASGSSSAGGTCGSSDWNTV
ncbi:hypothetical protein SAMN04488693_12218 [Arthrobacter subterraneus]|uniref:Uncharacterized protein n=1 Tax=Arthrobacter subterraneus TaxID=335973 RepID=A0A1G8N6V6_9MICC|nr:hypothetical protein SAMN04488693_12218 [Arthrobacter subterraneus]